MKTLFICKGNWFRSQIAEAVYNKLTGTMDAFSAGTYTGASDEPAGQILQNLYPNDSNFFEVMESHDLFLRDKHTKRLSPEMLAGADTVVSMAEEPFIPDFLKNDPRVVWWDVKDEDVVDKNIAEQKYQEIKKLIQTLL